MEGDEVVTVFHVAGTAIRNSALHPVPLKSLVGFERVTLSAGESTSVDFTLEEDAFALTNQKGESVVYPGEREIVFSYANGNVTIHVDTAKTLMRVLYQ